MGGGRSGVGCGDSPKGKETGLRGDRNLGADPGLGECEVFGRGRGIILVPGATG